MTELANAADLVRECTTIADAAAELPDGLTMTSPTDACGAWQYDARRRQSFRACAEWIDGRWEGFVSMGRKAQPQ